jgi:transposase
MTAIGMDTHKRTAGVGRLGSDAKFARLAGVAPIPASSGNRTRYRLDRGGNRQQAEGKSRMEALRCLKRHLARRVWRLLIDSEIDRSVITPDTQRGTPSPQIAVAA